MSDRFARLRQLFDAARELAAADRAAWLAEACSDDPTLAAEVVAMLAHDRGSAALQQPVQDAAADEAAQHPRQIGPYRILKPLGEGGMGTVYLAEQRTPVQRRVALKLVKLGMDSRAILARFEQERQALALMNHDGIAKVFDCGTSERGQPFFVMELVDGVPLNRFCEARNLPLRERLVLVQQVCEAVQHAHQKGVVHRDLKPGNVLVTDQGGPPRPKVIDFGLAKARAGRLADHTVVTEAGMALGTPEYMAPEQIAPDEQGVDTRADVYALGVMLYEVLVGSLPFSSRQLRDHGWHELRRVLCETEPPRPSSRVLPRAAGTSAIAKARAVSPAALHRALHGDLDWVVLKALEKDRNRRYGSPQALADDLQRYLDGEPLAAGPPSARYRLGKLARRYRAQLSVVALVFVTAVVGGGVAVWFYLAREAVLRDFETLATHANQLTLTEQERLLHPAWPERREALALWIHEAGTLVDRRPQILEAVQSIERRTRWVSTTDARSTREFESPAERFLYGVLQDTTTKLEVLSAETIPAVRLRLRWATMLTEHEAAPTTQARWAEARAAIASSPHYAADPPVLRDELLHGLVPIGPNPKTGLWEFYDLRSAWNGRDELASIPVPTHLPSGAVTMTADTGIVFVLVPGGKFWMGAQADDPQAPNHDPEALPDELPVRTALRPFLVARHELSRAQWQRLGGGDAFELAEGAIHGGVTIGMSHPAEHMTKSEAAACLRRHGMELPTEAQWEYACRAGTTTPWWPGADLARAPTTANVLDQSVPEHLNGAGLPPAGYADGCAALRPIGTAPANDFGLCDTHGNVAEWCRDHYTTDDSRREPRTGDGLRPAPPTGTPTELVARGGSFLEPPGHCTSSRRDHFANQDHRHHTIGVRPVRPLGD